MNQQQQSIVKSKHRLKKDAAKAALREEARKESEITAAHIESLGEYDPTNLVDWHQQDLEFRQQDVPRPHEVRDRPEGNREPGHDGATAARNQVKKAVAVRNRPGLSLWQDRMVDDSAYRVAQQKGSSIAREQREAAAGPLRQLHYVSPVSHQVKVIFYED